MTHLLSPEGLAAIARTVQAAPLLAFDFDGTLAPIVERPADARVPADVADRLGQLAAYLPIGIITGRTVADVRPRLGFPTAAVVGSHGAEDPVEGSGGVAVEALSQARESLRRQARALAEAGVVVEDKGASIALHYRGAPSPEAALNAIDLSTAGLGPAVAVHGGKRVVNLVWSQAKDKAAALRAMVTRLGRTAALYVGDDLNDEPVFASAEPSWLTVKIGTEQATEARFFLNEAAELPLLLSALLTALRESR